MNGPGSVQNLEEAAAIASEFISSLDNLPSEVAFLLNEIKYKDQHCADLQAEIQKDSQRYFKHALKHPSGSFDTTDNSDGKYASIPAKVRAAYDELDVLSDEKLVIAKRLTTLLNRHQLRLHIDLAKVAELQGEILPPMPTSGSVGLQTPIIESLRAASVADLGMPPQKRLKTAVNKAPPVQLHIKPPQRETHSSSRLRGSRAAYKDPTPPPPAEMDIDMDAEGEEENGEEEDTNLYCFCHKQSYGDMIGCDNENCVYQWFHLDCVGEKMPLPDKWYCPDCRKNVKKKKK